MEEGKVLTAGHSSHSVLVLLWLSGTKLSHREKNWLERHRLPSTMAPGSLWIAGFNGL